MELLIASAIAILSAAGLRLIFEGRSFPVILGTAFLSHAVNLFLFASGHLVRARPPLVDPTQAGITDPLPQALVLTAIVISFATTALFLVVLIASRGFSGTDHVDGREDAE